MKSLPIHFFTIVLNGEPFIRYHIEVFRQLNLPWHWHIVEGVAALSHDTAWSVENGGRVSAEFHRDGTSVDSTSAYIDQLKAEFPDNITIYRKPKGTFWDGKREMVNAPLPNIKEEALLFQLDSDEFWTAEQITNLHRMFVNKPERTAAWFWCWFFVGPQLVVSSRNCYGANPSFEWQRVWRFHPGCSWATHEPPCLVDPQGQDLGRKNPFSHFETEQAGLVFQHFAYVTEAQLQFKEKYYGYAGAVQNWKALQQAKDFPVLLRDYFSWVKDSTIIEPAERLQISSLFERVQEKAKESSPLSIPPHSLEPVKIVETSFERGNFLYVIDGVYFAIPHRGIARVWKTLLEAWSKSGFGENILLLDRGGTAPKIPGIRTRNIPPYDQKNPDSDRALLERVCREEGATLFSSTYYTTPESTPSVLLVHDMIPEVQGWDLEGDRDWQDKRRAILQACGYICVSENTRRNLFQFYPALAEKPTQVIHNAYDRAIFNPASGEEILHFYQERNIQKPYFLLVGSRLDYKNAQLLFDALALLPSQYGFAVFCTGDDSCVQQVVEYGRNQCGSDIHFGRLSDRELSVAYSGAMALAFPSVAEGFGLPLLEAMACLCPVVSYPAGASLEVLDDAGLIAESPYEFASALCEVQKPLVRSSLTRKGLTRSKAFSWSQSAQQFEAFLLKLVQGAGQNLSQPKVIAQPDARF